MRYCYDRLVLLLLAAATFGMGCSENNQARTPAAGNTQPVAVTADTTSGTPGSAGEVFTHRGFGISLTYPSGWARRASTDHALLLVPASAGAMGASEPAITLDVPELPWHIPGMIPLGSVKSGYLDDLRKQAGQIQIAEDTAWPIPDAQARLVRSVWGSGQRQRSETALLIVHADHVYILRANADDAAYRSTRQAFDAVVRSLRWTR